MTRVPGLARERGASVVCIEAARLSLPRGIRPTVAGPHHSMEVVERGSPALRSANATGVDRCRRRRSESPARARGSKARQVCPRVVSVAEVGKRRHRPREGRTAGSGALGRGFGSLRPKASAGERRRHPSFRWQSRIGGEGLSRAFERTSRGEGPCWMEDTPGPATSVIVHASAHRQRPWSMAGGQCASTRQPCLGREECQRLGRAFRARSAEANRSVVKQANPPRPGADAAVHGEPPRRGCSCNVVRWQKSVGRIQRMAAR
jgi:hypothetical protein